MIMEMQKYLQQAHQSPQMLLVKSSPTYKTTSLFIGRVSLANKKRGRPGVSGTQEKLLKRNYDERKLYAPIKGRNHSVLDGILGDKIKTYFN